MTKHGRMSPGWLTARCGWKRWQLSRLEERNAPHVGAASRPAATRQRTRWRPRDGYGTAKVRRAAGSLSPDREGQMEGNDEWGKQEDELCSLTPRWTNKVGVSNKAVRRCITTHSRTHSFIFIFSDWPWSGSTVYFKSISPVYTDAIL